MMSWLIKNLEKRINIIFLVPYWNFQKEIISKNFEDFKKASLHYAHTSCSMLYQISNGKYSPEGKAARKMLKINSKFNFWNVHGRLIHVYITYFCNIGYAITTLLQFFSDFFTNFYHVLLTVSLVWSLGVSVLINRSQLTVMNNMNQFLTLNLLNLNTWFLLTLTT